MKILQEEDKLLEIVQLVGSDALPERQQLSLEIARLIREFILQQNAFHEVDTNSELEKSYLLMKTVLYFSEQAHSALELGAPIKEILATESRERISLAKFDKDYRKILEGIRKETDEEFKVIRQRLEK